MTQIFEGSCQCGEIKYQVTGVPMTLFTCHCTECQKQSASAFGMALWIRKEKVDLLSGTLKTWIRQLPGGGEMACDFCPTCGTRIFHRQLQNETMISIKPGSLDNTKTLKPSGHIWTQSAQQWLKLESDSLLYPENPDSFEALIQSYGCDSK